MEDTEVDKCLWKPNRRRKTKMDVFREHVNKKYGKNFADYRELYRWSIEDIEDFWETWWEFGKFLCMITPCQVLEPDLTISQVPRWFIGARLNFAANLLRFRDNHIAIYATGEGQERITTITFSELYQKVAACSRALTALGVESGERVVGYLPNCPAAIEAMLASASIGAVWSSTSPDFGVTGVLERFNQIAPSVLFSVDAVVYNGKVHDHLAKVTQVVKGLGYLKKVVIVPFVNKKCDIDISGIPNCVFLDDFVKKYEGIKEPLQFAELPFHFPLFIMFSSGTTGEPKCIVHSAGGTLLQITKEHILHCDIDRRDVLTYYTTTGWMMWNWLVVGLYTGCALVLYDGSPLLPTPSILWDLVDKLGITVLGTGAKWLAVLEEKGVKPKETHDLTTLRAILSTGSPLPPKSFRYVYRDIKKDVLLGSISGGTDIISCFMGSNPSLPVYEGEIQSRNLGMAVEAWDDYGQPVFDQSGELVCTKPFPSMPTHFWNDDGGIKYTKAYFSVFPNTWTHGDYIMINSKTGGITMLGRSDGTLNPSGVRFGSSEIYSVVDQFEEVSDSVCVGQRNQVGEERVVLFLKLHKDAEFCQELTNRMRKSIRSQLSARHVPSVILPIDEIPYTISGKKVEVAVRHIIHGQEVKNKSSLVNPESLALYADLPELHDWVSK